MCRQTAAVAATAMAVLAMMGNARAEDVVNRDRSVPLLGQVQPPPASGLRTFDIPAQPLADALIAFGAATGLQVFYDGALAVGRRSAPAKGLFTPMQGLQTLLRGTGYAPHATDDADTITIVMAPSQPAWPTALPARTAAYGAMPRRAWSPVTA